MMPHRTEQNVRREPVLIVGAGPAGLSLAYHLSRKGIQARLLEAGQIGDTWMRVPRDMQLISPWWTNVLTLRDSFRHFPFAKVPAAIFHHYLVEFAAANKLDITLGVKVVAIEPSCESWTAIADDGRHWTAKSLVIATGYFSNPQSPIPNFETDHSLATVHAAEIRDYTEFAARYAGKTVIIVGKRVTAGQLMVELFRRGVNVILSARTPIEFRPAGFLSSLRDQVYFFWEAVRVLVQPRLWANSFPPMDGGETERLLTNGSVPLIDPISNISKGHVITITGQTVSADLVVLATGYQPALLRLRLPAAAADFLKRPSGYEMPGSPGLYVLGLDHLQNFRSRYLRGIRSDAKKLARHLSAI